MTALGIEFSSRDADLFYWPAPSTHGKSPEYLAVSDKIEELWARYIRLCDVEPLPQFKLDEIQDEINRLLLKLARENKRVVRLKGGDPFIFGRGGEEMELLVDAGVHVEVIPGVTAAAGVSAYAGIPLTHREHAQSVVFATGFLKDGKIDLDWPMLARPHQTVVIYMGISRLADICAQLVAHGLPPSTPAGVIERGTTHAQRVVVGNLATLAQRALDKGVRPPSLTVIGTVVGLYPKLAWFEPQDQPKASPLPHAGCAVVHGKGEA